MSLYHENDPQQEFASVGYLKKIAKLTAALRLTRACLGWHAETLGRINQRELEDAAALRLADEALKP